MNKETKTNKIFSDSHHRTPLKKTGEELYTADLEEAVKNIVFTWWVNEEMADTFEIESVVFKATGSQHSLPRQANAQNVSSGHNHCPRIGAFGPRFIYEGGV